MSPVLAHICRSCSGRAGPLCPGTSDINLFCYRERVVDLDTEIAYGALDFSCGRAGAGRPEDFQCAGRSGSPSSFSTNASRTASDRARCHQSIRRPGARTGLSMATSNIARSRVRPWIISRVLIAHTCFGRNGGLAPVSLPLFQGVRVRAVKRQLSLSE